MSKTAGLKIQALDFKATLKALKKRYPDAHCALNFENPFQLLIATILSAQCTDIRVNIVTKELFKKFPDAKAMSEATLPQIEELIHSAGFYKNKAKNIKECCLVLVQKYQGQVPKTMEELYELAGVGRKTANVVMGNAYGIASGVVVDTHVGRLANRFGWVKTLDAVRIENVLNVMAPKKEWVMLPHYLISHGRAICKARSPDCSICFLNSACPKRGV
ncbi:MAG: endonuclease III [Bdellovibrio sp.]|nr:endonuclease III [Bdellovibrio sp.]